MDKVDRASRARFVISTPFGWEFQLEYDESLTIAALQEFLPLLLSLGGGNSFSSWYGRENCSFRTLIVALHIFAISNVDIVKLGLQTSFS